jgi:cytochrome bd-type quinol oxidase subunit 2
LRACFTDDLRPIYEGTLFGLLNPLALYCGLVSLVMLVMHGAAWLSFKSEGSVADRAAAFGSKAAWITAVLFAGEGILIWLGAFGGYLVTSSIVCRQPATASDKPPPERLNCGNNLLAVFCKGCLIVNSLSNISVALCRGRGASPPCRI